MTQSQRVRVLFEHVVELPPDAARAYLDRACGDDAALRREVEALLTADRAEPHRALRLLPLDAQFLATGRPGESIGPYRLIRILGEGGFGVVWLAEQMTPVRREVALKIIKPGMDTRQVMARFETERQTLAMLSHPNVARVFDGGATAGGRPYFAMECVVGQSITAYCDENRLDVPRRLRLFLDVCGAIAHAHQKGVIHRDIKPSNVLVQTIDRRPLVKVIDFGIAKAIESSADAATMYTQVGQLIGTPDYMSPEQADASPDIDTRSDLYALGVLLYELLTGSTPLRAGGTPHSNMAELLRAVRESEAPRPSTRISGLGGAAGEIAARRGAVPARLRSLLRGDLDWVVMKALEKDRARRYESAGALAADIEHFLRDEPVKARPPSTLYRFQKLVKRHRVGMIVAAVIGVTVCGSLIGISIALVRTRLANTEAEHAREQSEAVNQFLVDLLGAANPEREGYRLTVVDAISKSLKSISERFEGKPELEAMVRTAIGTLYNSLGLFNESAQQLEAAVEISTRIRGPRAYETISAELDLGNTLSMLNQNDRAERILREVRRIAAETLAPDSELELRAAGALGEVLQKQGKHAEAEPLLGATLTKLRATAPPGDMSIMTTLSSLAASLSARRRYADAAPLYQELLDIARRNYPEYHPATLAAINNMATLLCNLKRYNDALPLQRELLDVAGKTLPPGHWQRAVAQYSYGTSLHMLGRDDQALPYLRKAHEIALEALGSDHFVTERCLSMLVAVLRNLEAPDALQMQRVLTETRIRNAGIDGRASVISVINEFDALLRQQTDDYRGPDVFQMLEETADRMLADHAPRTQAYLANLGWILIQQQRFEEAEIWLMKSQQLAAADPAVPAAERADAIRLLVTLYDAWGQRPQAAAWRARLAAATSAPVVK